MIEKNNIYKINHLKEGVICVKITENENSVITFEEVLNGFVGHLHIVDFMSLIIERLH